MITAWTYQEASEDRRYWIGRHSTPIIWIDRGDGSLPKFHRVSDGAASGDYEGYDGNRLYRRKPLPREWWPQWLSELDDFGVDEGL